MCVWRTRRKPLFEPSEVAGGGRRGAGGRDSRYHCHWTSFFLPAAPYFLFMHGKDMPVPKGAEITAYVNGDVRLETKNFRANSGQSAQSPAEAQPSPTQSEPGTSTTPPVAAPTTGTVEVTSIPEGAEVYADGAFIGNAPATLKLSPGEHKIRVSQSGFKEWSRDVAVQAGSEAHLSATLEKQN